LRQLQLRALHTALPKRIRSATQTSSKQARGISSAKACKELVKSIISNYKLPYITITPVFSVCAKHGYIAGEHEFCPLCDAELIENEKKNPNKERR